MKPFMDFSQRMDKNELLISGFIDLKMFYMGRREIMLHNLVG